MEGIVAIECFLYACEATPACRALQAWGADPLTPDAIRTLESRYCSTGAFINCPLFRFVQERLEAMHVPVSTEEPRQVVGWP